MENALHRFHIDGDGAAVVAQSNSPPAKLLLMMGNGTGAAGKREILFFFTFPVIFADLPSHPRCNDGFAAPSPQDHIIPRIRISSSSTHGKDRCNTPFLSLFFFSSCFSSYLHETKALYGFRVDNASPTPQWRPPFCFYPTTFSSLSKVAGRPSTNFQTLTNSTAFSCAHFICSLGLYTTIGHH